MAKERTYSTKELAETFDVSISTIHNHVKVGKLRASTRLSRLRITETEAKRWAREQGLMARI